MTDPRHPADETLQEQEPFDFDPFNDPDADDGADFDEPTSNKAAGFESDPVFLDERLSR